MLPVYSSFICEQHNFKLFCFFAAELRRLHLRKVTAMKKIIQTANVQVRMMKLASRQQSTMHYHKEITDYVFPLNQSLVVILEHPREEHLVEQGSYFEIKAPRPHAIFNEQESELSYLLVQGVGSLDFNELPV